MAGVGRARIAAHQAGVILVAFPPLGALAGRGLPLRPAFSLFGLLGGKSGSRSHDKLMLPGWRAR
jgi:hypothetical protein